VDISENFYLTFILQSLIYGGAPKNAFKISCFETGIPTSVGVKVVVT